MAGFMFGLRPAQPSAPAWRRRQPPRGGDPRDVIWPVEFSVSVYVHPTVPYTFYKQHNSAVGYPSNALCCAFLHSLDCPFSVPELDPSMRLHITSSPGSQAHWSCKGRTIMARCVVMMSQPKPYTVSVG